MVAFHTRLSEFASDYDAFIVDLWGVIHDGQALYPDAKDALQAMQTAGKKILFLSNAPKRAHKAIAMLTSMGVERHLYEDVLSSGEVFYQSVISGYLGQKYIYIGPERDRDLMNGLPYQVTQHAGEASFAVVTGYDHDESLPEEKFSLLETIRASQLPLYCINPDKVVVRQTGERSLCAGVIADQYKQMGGEVIYYGKPHKKVYEACLARLGKPDLGRIAAIGDSPDTDIKGALSMGIDPVLVTGGVLRTRIAGDMAKVIPVCTEYEAIPQKVIPAFIW